MATDFERLEVRLEASVVKFERAMAKARGETFKTTRTIESRFSKMNKNLNTGFLGLSSAWTKALATIAAAKGFQSLLDSSTRVTNALKVAGLEGEALTQVYDRLFESAQRNAAPLEALTDLYARAALVQGELGVSTEELLNFTDKIAVALRVSGKSASEASGALLQLSQALGSGVVRAEEFNSILEGALPVAQAAAAGLEEAGGSVAKLRQLVVDGKVSSEAFFRAFEAGSVILEEKVAGAELTVSQGFVKMRNAMIDAARKMDETTGISADLAELMAELAGLIDGVGDAFDRLKGPLDRANAWLQDFFAKVQAAGEATGKFLGISGFGAAVGLGAETGQTVNTDAKGDKLTVGGSVKPVSINDFAAPSDTGGGGGPSQSQIDLYERATAAIEKQTEALRLEAEIMGLSTFEVEKARAAQELLNEAKAQGLEITPELAAEIDRLSTEYAQAAQNVEDVYKKQQMLNDVAGEFGGAIGNAFSIITSGTEDMEKKLAALVVQLILAIAQAKILNSTLAGTPGGSFLSSLLGGFGGFFASGGTLPAGQWGIAGEKGPEPFFAKPGGGVEVMSNAAMSRVPASAGGTQVVRLLIEGQPGSTFHADVAGIAGDVAGPIAVEASDRRVKQFGRMELPGRMIEINGRVL